MINRKQFTYLIGLTLFLVIVAGYFFYSGAWTSRAVHQSIEVGISSLSPSGAKGGLAIPASCPSFAHVPLECNPKCSNGIDDDGDGFVDWNINPVLSDPGCTSASDNNEADPGKPTFIEVIPE